MSEQCKGNLVKPSLFCRMLCTELVQLISHSDRSAHLSLLIGKDVSLLLFGFCLYFVSTVLFIHGSHYLFIHSLFLCTRNVLENESPKRNESSI